MIRRSNSLCLEFLIILKNKIMNDKNSAINAVALRIVRSILALIFPLFCQKYRSHESISSILHQKFRSLLGSKVTQGRILYDRQTNSL